MALEVILPRVDMDMTEGKIAHWYVQNGDAVSKGQVIFEIETDKATMEIEAAADGVFAGSDGAVGVVMPVGRTVAWILAPGEAMPGAQDVAVVPSAAATATLVPHAGAAAVAAETATGARNAVAPLPRSQHTQGATSAALLRATPLARSLSRAQGVDLATVQGSGPDGRVLARDLAGHAASAAPGSHGASTHASAAPRSGVSSAKTPATGDLHLHWFNRQPGTPFVLLHGFGTSSGGWRKLAEQLGDLPVLAIDLPNHGKSPRMDTPSLDAVAQLVLARLDREGLTTLHLAGHSMGGGVALALTGPLQERLRSLTLLAPLGLGPEIHGAFIQGILRAGREASLRPWLAALFGDAAQLTGSFTATAWQELADADTRAALATMADRLLPDGTQAALLRDRLEGLQVPAKLIWGTLDRIVPVRQSAGLPGLVALHLLAGVGHLPYLEATAQVALLLRQQWGAGGR